MHEKFVAAVDLGTSRITLMVGKKDALGLLSVVAVETVESNGCIRRGYVYKAEEATAKVTALLRAVNSRITPKIEKVYVGIGGQSVRSTDYSIVRNFSSEVVVDKALLDSIAEECVNYEPELVDLLEATSPEYYIDGRLEPEPLGVHCSKIEAKYKLIVGRPSIKRILTKSIKDGAGIPIAGYFISAEAVAAATLTVTEKDLGCALIDFGAGKTTLSIYKNKLLKYMVTLPLGSDLITKDICSLNIVEEEAEAYKKQNGQAVAESDKELLEKEFTSQHVDAARLNLIIEARVDEILSNVISQIELAGFEKTLASGIVITGGGANLKKLSEAVKDKINCTIRIAGTQKAFLAEETDITRQPDYTAVTGLLLLGEEHCAKEMIVAPQEPPKSLFEDDLDLVRTTKETRKPPKEEKKPEKKEGGLFKNLSRKFEGAARSLFDDEAEE